MAKTQNLFKLSPRKACELRGKMLGWYDANARVIPWRAPPGMPAPDPYHVWLSEIMCQQTTVTAVIPYFLKFTARWPRVFDLASAEKEDVMAAWAGLGYYARARNLLACARIIANERDGIFPDTAAELKKLPGIGDYTATAIAAIAFDGHDAVVDGNIERIAARYFEISDPLPRSKPLLKQAAALLFEGSAARTGDFAQSLMDLGAGICTPRSPKCTICPIAKDCAARKSGTPEKLPARIKDKSKPQRHGYVYWIEDGQGNVLLERRPESVMMGGMLGLPGSEWVDLDTAPDRPAFINTVNMPVKERVLHSFTHFDLSLQIMRGEVRINNVPENYFWHVINDFDSRSMPTVFRKAWKLRP